MNKKSIIKTIATLTLAASFFSFTGGSNVIDFNAGTSNVITVSASASGTGTYMVNTSAGLNVRSSASSSGNKVGAATNGVQFNVTQVSGSWGYTPAIQTTSGTKNGWVSLDYCKKLGNNWAHLSDGTYAVKPQCSPNSCLDVEACGTSNGANIHLWEYVGNANQKVNLRNNGDGTVSLFFTHCNKAVDISGGNTGNGVNCQLWESNGTPAQKYYLFDEGNGYYSLHLASDTNYVLDISGCLSSNGTNCQLWSYNRTPAQLFKFELVNQNNSQNMSWPVDGAYCSWNDYNKSTWSWSENSGASGSRVYHLGLDLKGRNKDVKAFMSGTVEAASTNSANGNYVIIRHTVSGKTVYSFYAHLSSRKVSEGDNVSCGTNIGVIGNTGASSKGEHLHFAITDTLWKQGSYYGYSTKFSGNKTTYGGVTYYNPKYVIENKKLP